MARFFIDRPIFAWVIALFILVMGAVAVTQLPIAQYPPVAPPSIVVTVTYPGASAQTLEDAVISVIEREMNGSPGMIYMESISQANGTGTITISYETGTNADLAPVVVHNRLSHAAPAAIGDPAGRARGQGARELFAVHHSVLRRSELGSGRARRLCGAHGAAGNPAHSRRRPGAIVRHRARNADLDRSGQAGRLQPVGERRQQCDPLAECTGVVGHHRRLADHPWSIDA